MNKKDRENIGACIRHELRKGVHTFTMCQCSRNETRTGKCWECWLSDLVNNVAPDFSIKGDHLLLKEEKEKLLAGD